MDSFLVYLTTLF